MTGSPRSCLPRSESLRKKVDPTAPAGGSIQTEGTQMGKLIVKHLEKTVIN